MRLASALAFAVVLAGCVTNGIPQLQTPAGDSAALETLPWTLTQCRYVVGWSSADPAKVQAQLPPGFKVQPGTPLGLPVPVEEVIIGTEAFECAEGAGLNGTVEPMLYASIWLPGTPPAE